jgi:peroxiredoxin Q/BCP
LPVAVGQSVPDFSAESTAGPVKLADFAGRHLVLYFYPKDNTPGCTAESMDFRDRHDEFVAAGASILGISRDSLRSHEGFKAKLGLPFELISDADERLCTLFGVIRLKNMYGKQVRGIERSTFLIGPTGVLLREWRGLKVPGHVEEVLAAVREA